MMTFEQLPEYEMGHETEVEVGEVLKAHNFGVLSIWGMTSTHPSFRVRSTAWAK